MIYTVYLLKDNARPGCAGLLEAIAGAACGLSEQGLTPMGVFTPLLGLASNEVYFVVTGSGDFSVVAQQHDISIKEQHSFVPTIRPTTTEPATRRGVYVFRWFDIKPGTAGDIVQLSGEAWPAFEAEFDTEIQGLFVEDQPSPEKMLLLTWYRDLSVWEASRNPQPSARENFLKRHQLTTSARPVATLLSVQHDTPALVSHT